MKPTSKSGGPRSWLPRGSIAMLALFLGPLGCVTPPQTSEKRSGPSPVEIAFEPHDQNVRSPLPDSSPPLLFDPVPDASLHASPQLRVVQRSPAASSSEGGVRKLRVTGVVKKMKDPHDFFFTLDLIRKMFPRGYPLFDVEIDDGSEVVLSGDSGHPVRLRATITDDANRVEEPRIQVRCDSGFTTHLGDIIGFDGIPFFHVSDGDGHALVLADSQPWAEDSLRDVLLIRAEILTPQKEKELRRKRNASPGSAHAAMARAVGGTNWNRAWIGDGYRNYEFTHGSRAFLLRAELLDDPDSASKIDLIAMVHGKEYPAIAERLGVPLDALPRTVTLKYMKKIRNGVVGRTRGTTMRCHLSTLLTPLEGAALYVHELTHVVQGYSLATFRRWKWITEGIADCMRYRFAPDSLWAKSEHQILVSRMSDDAAFYKDGYFTAAAFLLFVQERYDPEILKAANEALRSRQYSDSFFKEKTSRTVDQLWAEFESQGRWSGEKALKSRPAHIERYRLRHPRA